MNRRTFLAGSLAVPLGTLIPAGGASNAEAAQTRVPRVGGPRLKISCNVYSFNSLFRSGEMDLDRVLDYCAELGFAAIDPTGYYFPGYPDTPSNEYLYRIKRRAFLLGLDISGTGVRNDFTVPDARKREADVELVKKWIECAARLSAPVLRVFSGRGVPAGHSEEEVYGWVADAIRKCAEHGRRYGVMVVLQNHDDFIKTADQTLRVLEMVNSEWLGLNLDIGSFRTGDAYAEIAKAAPFAVTWQIKENIGLYGKEVKTDLRRIVQIVNEAGYRGYLPLETLGAGDPRVKLRRFYEEFHQAMG
jgi:sugar phosphate isomerase/epimerase